jgi:MoxR-like ATPase
MTLDASRATQTQGAALLHTLIENVERVILGKREAITFAVVGLLAEGHVLLEDLPGTGKTTLARALAQSVELSFRRLQFTADLLPSDVLGLSTHDPGSGGFRFHPGPIFCHVVLADELNRTPPRTQSALLEAMNARKVSIEGETRDLPRPFMVIATQNPLEFEGTYPLPESQLDRFLLRIRLGYPSPEVERAVLRSQTREHPLDGLRPVLDQTQLLKLIAEARAVRIEDALLDYLLAIVAGTRRSGALLLGASTRAALGLQRAAQALALIEGRDYCVPDDVKRLAVPVLAHRVVPAERGALDLAAGSDVAETLVAELVESIPVPE